MGDADYFAKGEWNFECDRCGFKFKSGQIAQEWTGLRVCRGPGTNDCWEPKHPQQSLRGRKDDQAPPWTRPDPEPTFGTSRVWNDTTKTWDVE